MSTAQTNLQKAISEIGKIHGKGIMKFASELTQLPRIPTSIFELDALLGGGIPMSRVTMFTGEPSGGKSTIALLTAANAQRIDRNTLEPLEWVDGVPYKKEGGEVGEPMNVVFLDAEGTFDPIWAESLGVNLDTLVYAPAAYQEQAYDIVVAMIRTGEVDLIILDSLAAMAPSTELGAATEDQHVGVSARINNKGFRKIAGEFNRLVATHPHAPAMIMINQLREKVAVMFGNPETTPGGRGQEFFASLKIKVWPVALGKAIKVDNEIVGRTSTFKIEKNKLNGVHGDGQFTVYTRNYGPYKKGETDSFHQVLEWAVRLDLVEKGGAWLTLPNGERFQGKTKALEYLAENPDQAQDLYQKVAAGVKEFYA